MGSIRPFAACAWLAVTLSPGLAQSAPPSSQDVKTNTNCASAAGTEAAATKPAPASADGTAPGNAGSTGWSGGTGGSYVGTVPAAPTEGSKTWQPATARGLDPLAPAAPAPKAC